MPILRQPERKARFEIRLRNIELRVSAHKLHNLERVDRQCLAQSRRLVGEGYFECVEIVTAILDHFGGADGSLVELAGQMSKDASQFHRGRICVRPYDGERRLVVIPDRRSFAHELRLEA